MRITLQRMLARVTDPWRLAGWGISPTGLPVYRFWLGVPGPPTVLGGALAGGCGAGRRIAAVLDAVILIGSITSGTL